MKQNYESPELHELGTLEALTRQNFNKQGSASDIYTKLTNGIVIGSLTPPPVGPA